MKLFEQAAPLFLIRVCIKKQGEGTEYITLCETTQVEVLNFIKSIIEDQKISPFVNGRVTNVQIREYLDGKNGKSVSISFKGIPPKQVKQLILNKIKN